MSGMQASPYDVVIMGCGPAGCAVAIEAARKGVRCLLVDKEIFPREKACGCTLSELALRSLKRLSLSPATISHSVTGLSVEGGTHSLSLPKKEFCVSPRGLLDNELLLRAESLGISTRLQTKVAILSQDDRRVLLRLSSPCGVEDLSTPLLVVAAGVGSHRSFGFNERLAPPSQYIGLTGFGSANRGELPSKLSLSVREWGYFGITPTSDSEFVVSAAVRPLFIREAKTLLTNECERYGLQISSFRGSKPFPVRAASPQRGRLFLVGDAFSYAHPFSGEGIGWALRDGMRLGNLLPKALKNPDGVPLKLWRAECIARSRIRAAKLSLIEQFLKEERYLSFGMRLVERFPRTTQLFSH